MRRGEVAALCLLFVVLLASTDASAAMVVKGDAKAWDEVRAAMLRMVSAKTYRTKMTFSNGTMTTTMTIETVVPDRIHSTGAFGAETTEMVVVGTTTRMRQGSGKWLCPPGSTAPSPLPKLNPDTMADEITIQRGPGSVIDGVPTQSYVYTTKSADVTAHYKLYIATATGLPKRMELQNDAGAMTGTFDFYDFGAPITIELPNCG